MGKKGRGGRKRGGMNELTVARVVELRKRWAIGQSDEEIKAGMDLTPRQFNNLVTRARDISILDSNRDFYTRFEATQNNIVRELAFAMRDARGVEFPQYGQVDENTGRFVANPETGQPYPRYQVPPRPGLLIQAAKATTMTLVRTAEMGFRLGVYEEKPQRLELSVGTTAPPDLAAMSEIELVAMLSNMLLQKGQDDAITVEAVPVSRQLPAATFDDDDDDEEG